MEKHRYLYLVGIGLIIFQLFGHRLMPMDFLPAADHAIVTVQPNPVYAGQVCTVTGFVYDIGGNPVEGSSVWSAAEPYENQHDVSNADGSYYFEWVWPTPGTYVVQVRFQQFGVTDPINVVVTEAPPNELPVVNANGPYHIEEDQLLTVTGAGSYDPEDSLKAYPYRWSWGDGTPQTISSEQWAHHTYTASGVYTIRLEVEDTYGAVGSDTTTVTVDPAGTNPPYIVSVDITGGDKQETNVMVGDTVTFNVRRLYFRAPWGGGVCDGVRGYVYDEQGNLIDTFDFTLTDNENAYEADYTYPRDGIYDTQVIAEYPGGESRVMSMVFDSPNESDPMPILLRYLGFTFIVIGLIYEKRIRDE